MTRVKVTLLNDSHVHVQESGPKCDCEGDGWHARVLLSRALREGVGGSWGRRDPHGELRGPWGAVMGQNEVTVAEKTHKGIVGREERSGIRNK